MIMLCISNEYYFIKENDDIENNDILCKFLICLLFNTNAYLISDKSNWFESHVCLLDSIRVFYPEESDNHAKHKGKLSILLKNLFKLICTIINVIYV